jgi:diphthamide synthase subunit DPH2
MGCAIAVPVGSSEMDKIARVVPARNNEAFIVLSSQEMGQNGLSRASQLVAFNKKARKEASSTI